jgi:hypothetical protein
MDHLPRYLSPCSNPSHPIDWVQALSSITTLTAEVDRLTGYSERLNGLRERLEDSKATLTAERDDYKAHFEVCDTNRQQVVIERDAYRAERDAALSPTRGMPVRLRAVCTPPG